MIWTHSETVMQILVDTSIWVDYFKGGEKSLNLDDLLLDDRVVINDIILAELIPLLLLKKQAKIIDLLKKYRTVSACYRLGSNHSMANDVFEFRNKRHRYTGFTYNSKCNSE